MTILCPRRRPTNNVPRSTLHYPPLMCKCLASTIGRWVGRYVGQRRFNVVSGRHGNECGSKQDACRRQEQRPESPRWLGPAPVVCIGTTTCTLTTCDCSGMMIDEAIVVDPLIVTQNNNNNNNNNHNNSFSCHNSHCVLPRTRPNDLPTYLTTY